MPSKLTLDKIEAIAQSYCTNGFNKAKALLDNGYSVSYANSGIRESTYKNIHLKEAIAAKIADIRAKSVANREQRQQFWTDMMTGEASNSDKLRASELLGRSEADFTDNVKQTGDGLSIVVGSKEDKPDLKLVKGA